MAKNPEANREDEIKKHIRRVSTLQIQPGEKVIVNKADLAERAKNRVQEFV